MEITDRRIKVSMFPWLAHGHICPFLELAKKLTDRNFHIYFCSTPINLNSIKEKIPRKYSSLIQLVELHLPSLPELPPHCHTTKGLPPHLMATLKEAFDMSSPNFSKILKTLNPDILIHDFLQPWAPALASSQNILAIMFLCSSATMNAFMRHWHKINPNGKFPFPKIFLRDYELSKFHDRFINGMANGIKNSDRVNGCFELSSKIVLIKSFKEIEGKYIDYVSTIIDKKFVPVDPLVQDPSIEEDMRSDLIEWLDKKERFSTVFISFGTEFFLTNDDVKEIAHGLELINLNFIWVVRFHVEDQTTIEDALPKGFLNKVKERGVMVENWAPQGRILGHESIGAFVSHCGWSSVMENMKYGVPIIAMPMHLDQPLNARFVEEVGVGVEVKRNKKGKLSRQDVAKVIKEVVMETNGERVRKKVKEMSENMRNKGDEEIDGVVEELVQLFMNNNCL